MMIVRWFALVALIAIGAASGAMSQGYTPMEALPASGALTVSGITSVGTSAVTVFSALSASVPRVYFRIANGNSPGGNSLFCTDDGSTPSASNFSFPVYAGAMTDSSSWPFVPNTIIQCISPGGTTPIKAESNP